MKFKSLLFITCIALFAFSACSNDDEPDFSDLDNGYVKFEGTIEKLENSKTRASSTSWGSADAIGIYMKTAGSNISASSAENVKYTTPGNGEFSAATTGIELPSDGSNVDFVAYYPYQTTITSYTYPINVSDQSDLTKIDLLYSNNATNTTNPIVDLNFKHKLSQLILNVTAADGVSSLSGLSLSVSGLITEGSFGLDSDTITLGTTKETLTPTVNVTTSATVNAILIPGDNLNNGKLTFTLNGKVYEWTPTDAQVLESGKKYTYSIQLTTEGVVVLDPSGTIEDWVEGNPGGSNVVLTPSEEDVFVSDKATVSLAAAASLSDVIQLTTQSAEAWTATSSETWLTLSPANGIGSTAITLTAEDNPGAARTATVTLTPTTASLSAVTVTVTQDAAGSVTPVSLLFPGSDFEDWAGFTGNLNQYGLLSHGVQSLTEGRDGSGALYITGTTGSTNQYLFTAQVSTPIPASATKVVLYLKGTATGKSLSFNVYSPGAPANGYYKYNLGVCNGDTDLPASAVNNYGGSIDTGGNWIKVTLDITGYALNTSGSIFALKTGSGATYDLYVDDITFE